ncbi:hypothetical protein LSAT2_026712 [Lamellibrachia satsuma]|nr:hypothetical protein LSAT2_026712 [Lamellibrachia satsuma]
MNENHGGWGHWAEDRLTPGMGQDGFSRHLDIVYRRQNSRISGQSITIDQHYNCCWLTSQLMVNNLGGKFKLMFGRHNPSDDVERYITATSSEDELKLCLSTGSQRKRFKSQGSWGATYDHTQPEVTRQGTARLGVLQSRLPVGVVGRDALISEVLHASFRFDRSLLRLQTTRRVGNKFHFYFFIFFGFMMRSFPGGPGILRGDAHVNGVTERL